MPRDLEGFYETSYLTPTPKHELICALVRGFSCVHPSKRGSVSKIEFICVDIVSKKKVKEQKSVNFEFELRAGVEQSGE